MRDRTLGLGTAVAFGGLMAVTGLAGTPEARAQDNPAHAHIGHVASGFSGTPDGVGLMEAAMAEAAVAARHAGLAAAAGDASGMRTHAQHVLHALDPETVEGGPGGGYGLIRAAEGVARHIELAAAAEGASDGVAAHSVHIATSARNTVRRANRMIEIIAAMADSEDVASMAAELEELAAALIAGVDANEDGRVGWQEGEGGLDAAQTHLGLLMRSEGIGG